MIKKCKSCRGITLFKFRKYLVEFWFCPANAYIPSHYHLHMHSIFVHLWGRFLGMKNDKVEAFRLFTFFRRVKVPAGMKHGFLVRNSSFMLFLNIERWIDDVRPSSAAKDIVYV